MFLNKILLLMQEYEKRNSTKFTDKERMLVLGVATDNFEVLEREQFTTNTDDNNDALNSKKESKTRRLVTKILKKLEGKTSTISIVILNFLGNVDDYTSGNGNEKKLHSNGSHKILESLNEHTNSVSSAFDCYSTQSKTSPSEIKDKIK